MMTSMGPNRSEEVLFFPCYIYMFMFDAIARDNKRKLTIPLKMCNTMRRVRPVWLLLHLPMCAVASVAHLAFNRNVELENARAAKKSRQATRWKFTEQRNRLILKTSIAKPKKKNLRKQKIVTTTTENVIYLNFENVTHAHSCSARTNRNREKIGIAIKTSECWKIVEWCVVVCFIVFFFRHIGTENPRAVATAIQLDSMRRFKNIETEQIITQKKRTINKKWQGKKEREKWKKTLDWCLWGRAISNRMFFEKQMGKKWVWIFISDWKIQIFCCLTFDSPKTNNRMTRIYCCHWFCVRGANKLLPKESEKYRWRNKR